MTKHWLLTPLLFLLLTRLALSQSQLSLTPGLSTSGARNSRSTNKFSINLVGGCSAGLKGFELGGIFNIDKKNVSGLQVAGVINIAGDSVHGMQAAGFANTAKYIHGLQFAEVYNYAGTVNGMQWSPFINRTRHLKGVQYGLINIADTSQGVSIGVLNFIRHGIHELSFYADELSPYNLAFRSGTRGLYGILYTGLNPDREHGSYYFGVGWGHQSHVSSQLAIRYEFSLAEIFPTTPHRFNESSALLRFNVDLHWQMAKNIAVSLGPSFNLYDIDNSYFVDGIRYQPLPYGYPTRLMGEGHGLGWIGWHVAIGLF